jgi:anion-transporting  ArsA/GET3 family ATPase
MTGLFDARFIINTGKGGVGKTTVTAAMACAMAARGKRVLLMELNAVDRLGSLFAAPVVGSDIVSLAPNIWAVNTTPADATREYAMMIVRVRAIYRAVFENRLVERFLKVIPGLPELTMLGKAYYHETEVGAHGRPKYDAVLIDAPATGHGMFLLQIPQVVSSAISSGPMASETRRMLDLLRDHERTMVNLITLPEELPVNETFDLRDQLRRAFDVRVGHVILNGVLPSRFSPEEAAQARTLLNTHGRDDDDLGALIGAAVFREERAAMQQQYVERVQRGFDEPVIQIPFYFEPRFDRSVLDRMGTHIATSVGSIR